MKDNVRVAGVGMIPFVKPGANATYPLMGAEAARLSRSTVSVANIPDMTGKTVIVTGTSSGIGRAVARTPAAASARVVFAVRSTEKGRAAATATAGVTEVRELDLATLDSVQAFEAFWDGGIDLLINNEGVSSSSLARNADGFEPYNIRGKSRRALCHKVA